MDREAMTPGERYEAIMGQAMAAEDIGLSKAEENAEIERLVALVGKRLGTPVERMREAYGRLLEHDGQCREEASREHNAAVATAARSIEGSAKDLGARIKAWCDYHLIETKGELEEIRTGAGQRLQEAKDRIADNDLGLLQKRREMGEKPQERAIAPPKGEVQILATTTLETDHEIASDGNVPRAYCKPDDTKIRSALRDDEDLEITGVTRKDKVRVLIPKNSGQVRK